MITTMVTVTWNNLASYQATCGVFFLHDVLWFQSSSVHLLIRITPSLQCGGVTACSFRRSWQFQRCCLQHSNHLSSSTMYIGLCVPWKKCHARSRHVTYTLIETLVSEVCMLHTLSMHASRYTRKMNFMMWAFASVCSWIRCLSRFYF